MLIPRSRQRERDALRTTLKISRNTGCRCTDTRLSRIAKRRSWKNCVTILVNHGPPSAPRALLRKRPNHRLCVSAPAFAIVAGQWADGAKIRIWPSMLTRTIPLKKHILLPEWGHHPAWPACVGACARKAPVWLCPGGRVPPRIWAFQAAPLRKFFLRCRCWPGAVCRTGRLVKIPAGEQPFRLIARVHGAGGIAGAFGGIVGAQAFGGQRLGLRVAQRRQFM